MNLWWNIVFYFSFLFFVTSTTIISNHIFLNDIYSNSPFLQLNLRHIIRRDILIYPGYVPEPGVKYKVFHYGLRFGVGNWSFDKADWRDVDMVNNCWAKFPEPPDPSTVAAEAENIRQRDLLSIECGRALNKALYLHHLKRNCPTSESSNNATHIEKTSGISLVSSDQGHSDSMRINRKNRDSVFDSHLQSTHGSHHVRSRWAGMFALWVFSVLGFLTIITVVLSSNRRWSSRTRAARSKKSFA